MAEIDILIRDTILKYLGPIILVILFLVIYLGELSKSVRDICLGKFLTQFPILYDKRLEDVKKVLFEDLNDLESKVTDLRNRGVLRILEIGVGAGHNLKYYPQQCRLVVVDPNKHFVQYFFENKNKFHDIVLEQFYQTEAENMSAIETESVDVVVTNLVQCSVRDVEATLSEISRVLVKGGRYYYLEHVMDFPSTRRQKIQKFLTRFGIWPWMFDGCCLDREIDVQIAKAGFSEVDQKRFFINSTGSRVLKIIEPHIVGIAVK